MAKQVPLHPSSPDMIKIAEDKWIFGEGKQEDLVGKKQQLYKLSS